MATKRAEIMTMDELAEHLNISKLTLCKLAQANKLPGQKIGSVGDSTRTQWTRG